MAEFLNDWASGFADRTPGCLHSATFYPEPGAAAYVAARLAAGAEIFKVHVQVGAFDVRDPLLADVWGVLEDAGTPVVIHAGSGPVGTPYTGPGPVADLLRSYPRLALVIAHLGAPEYAEFVALAETYERVLRRHHDGVHRLLRRPRRGVPGRPWCPRLRDLQPKVLLGSDFPNIPYPYASQLERPGPARPRRRLAPRRLLGERRPPVRCDRRSTRRSRRVRRIGSRRRPRPRLECPRSHAL